MRVSDFADTSVPRNHAETAWLLELECAWEDSNLRPTAEGHFGGCAPICTKARKPA
jgi:hypothetical protein